MPVPTLRPTDHAGLIAAAETLLGFRPRQSLVVLFLEDAFVRVCMRADLADLGDRGLLRQAATAAGRVAADRAVLVAFVDDLDDRSQQQQVRLWGVELEAATITADPLTVSCVLVASDEEWCSLLGGRVGEPRPIDEVRDSPIAAERVFHGLPLASSREEVFERVRPGAEDMPAGFGRGFAEAMAELSSLTDEEVADTAAALTSGPLTASQASPRLLGRAVAVASNTAALEVLLRAVPVDPDEALGWIEFWARCARIARGSASLVPLVLVGIAAWAGMGDGALANASLEYAQRIDSGHPGVLILYTANQQCLEPSAWIDFVADLDARQAELAAGA